MFNFFIEHRMAKKADIEAFTDLLRKDLGIQE